MVMECYRPEGKEMSRAECKTWKCQGAQAAWGHAAVALDIPLNAEEQVCAQLPKSVAKGGNFSNTNLQVTSDSAVQANWRQWQSWGRQTPVPAQGGQKLRRSKTEGRICQGRIPETKKALLNSKGQEVGRWVRCPFLMRSLTGHSGKARKPLFRVWYMWG